VSLSYDLLIRGGTCVLHRGLARVDLGIIAGRIAAIGELDPDGAAQVLDARGLHVLPGVIDTQVQLREPGLEASATIAAGTRAAVLGGVTSVLELPDLRPPTITAAALEDKISRARARSWCDFACFLGASHEAEEQGRLERLPGCAGLAVVMTGAGRTPGDDELLLRALSRGHRRVSVRCDDDARATQRLLGLARRAGRRVHLMRLGGADDCNLASQHRDLATTAVTMPDLGDPDDRDHPRHPHAARRAALWQAVQDGVVDLVASAQPRSEPTSDTSPAPDPSPAKPLLPALLEHVRAGNLGLTHLVELLATGPARVYNIARKGRLAVGLDADLCLVDLHAGRDLGDDWSTDPHGPPNQGRPRATILRGQILARDGEIVGEQDGNPLRFADTLRMVAL
jgi:dihydroorotase